MNFQALCRQANEGSPMTKVLVVDDEPWVHREMQKFLAGYDVFPALSLDLAMKLFDTHAGAFDVMVVDGRLNPHYGHELVRYVREQGFKGAIIANSSDDDLNKYMIRDGANHAVRLKIQAARKVIDLFPLPG